MICRSPFDLSNELWRMVADEVLERTCPQVSDELGRRGEISNAAKNPPRALGLASACLEYFAMGPPVALEAAPRSCCLLVTLAQSHSPGSG